MIHSLSGGVIAENGTHTFVKVECLGTTLWFLSPTNRIAAGDRVIVPFGPGDFPQEATVVKTEEASAQCAPVPMKGLKEIYRIL